MYKYRKGFIYNCRIQQREKTSLYRKFQQNQSNIQQSCSKQLYKSCFMIVRARLWIFQVINLRDSIVFHQQYYHYHFKLKLFKKIINLKMLYKKKQTKIQYEKFKRQDYLPYEHEGFATLAIHAGQDPEPVHGSVNVPIHMTSTYAQNDIAKPYGKFDYSRGGNPTRQALETCIKSLQYGTHAIAFSSGCGAIATIMHILNSGDHAIICDDVYGGTMSYMKDYCDNHFKISCQFLDMIDIQSIQKAIKPQTKLLWIETPTSPILKILDIQKIAQICKKNNIISVCDNTFATPLLQNPLQLGIDVVCHSGTKYLGGHSDIVMGVIALKDDEIYKRIYHAAYSLGANPSPFDCFLMLRGLKTLQQRVIKATHNAYHLAHFLQKHELVSDVIYPGLKSHPQHQLCKKQMRGFGAMISFRIKGEKEEVRKFLKSLNIFTFATSLGGVHSLAILPAFTSHVSLSVEHRAKLGITDNLIRLSIGTQSTQDIILDVDLALRKSRQ